MSHENPQVNSGPGFARHPGYTFIFSPTQQRIRVISGGDCIADTTQALVLNENSYSPVYYIPRVDVQMDALTRTDHSTYCPFKGQATYWALTVGGQHPEGVAWSYETPYDESLQLKEHIAFYSDRVDEIRVDAAG